MKNLKLFPFTQVHMHATRQAGVKAANCAHDVNALEFIRAVLLEDGCVLHRILIWARCAVDIAHAAIPGRRRIGMVVGDLAVLDDQVVRKHATHSFVEAAADGLLWYREFRPCPGMTGIYLCQRLVYTVERDSSGVGLEVGARAVTLDSVAPLRNLPLKLHLWLRGALGEPNLHAVSGGLDVAAQVYDTGQGCRPQASNSAAAGVQRQVFARPFIKPARRHSPAIVAVEGAFLWFGDGCLVPGMVFIDRVAEWVAIDERPLILPVIVVGTAQQYAD